MSYNPNQDHDTRYTNWPEGFPPSETYGSPQNPYGAPQEPYNQPQAHYGYGATPQDIYGTIPYQQPAYTYGTPPAQATTIQLGEAIRQLPKQYFKVLTRPSAATFAEELNKANWGTLLAQLLGIALLSFVLPLLLIPILPLLLQHILEILPATPGGNSLPRSALQQFQTSYLQSVVSSLVRVPIYFFIGQGMYYFLAKAFHGTGTFLVQGYTALLFYVPLTIIGSVLGTLALALDALAPVPTGLYIALSLVLLIGLPLGVYQIALQIFTIRAAHRLSGGKATAVVLIPHALFLVLYLVLVFFLVFLFILILSTLQLH